MAYVLDVANRVPSCPARARDVSRRWAGVRPLISRPVKGTSTRRAPPGPHAAPRLDRHRRRQADHLPADGRADGRPGGPALEGRSEGVPHRPRAPARALRRRLSGVLPPPVTREAVDHYCQQEWAARRRHAAAAKSWHYYHPEARRSPARLPPGWAAARLGRCRARRRSPASAARQARPPNRDPVAENRIHAAVRGNGRPLCVTFLAARHPTLGKQDAGRKNRSGNHRQ